MSESVNDENKQQEEVVEVEKSSTGMDLNVAGLLCYLGGFITGIIFFVIEKESSFIKFHALQSIFTFVAVFIISMVLAFIPIIGWFISIIIYPLSLVLWIILMIKAYQGERFKLPIIGDMVEKQL
ncbi:DUF4870 domain-containing protein [Salinibacillus xinjiangensis]|uniref:DUF4870 domain-containing protein n=1 Tax=Salinibacillus xinjiangensis TaxID=1229268 RepID=A0A6G1X4J8_9BACI|nr:DUF4870 domain-containing protein [Salinibacillus xinjiangensis]MRG85849.1 DUF4870 domain-containing protein [Salinibacillus xinjiangensis]